MKSHRRPALIAVVAAIIGMAAGAASAETPKTSQIYQQRDPDGRAVLTDRPSATSVTERTWQVDREDPAVAERRALEVQRHADAVSERVQRSIEAQERRASDYDLMRLRLAQIDRQSEVAGDDDGIATFGYGGFANRAGDRRPHRPHAPPHRAPLRGSATLGSR